MIACVDVDYRPDGVLAALVGCRAWTDATPCVELTETITRVEPYEPGQFYKRELPCLLAVLRRVREPVDLVVVDGFVWLGDESRPGGVAVTCASRSTSSSQPPPMVKTRS